MHHASEYILPTACLTLIAAGLALAWQLSAKNVSSTGRPASDIISGARFENVTAQGYTNGERAWNVTAPRVIADRSAHQLDFQGGINTEITYAGTKRVIFNAPRAQYHDENGRFDAAGPLFITLLPPAKPTENDIPVSFGTITITTLSLIWMTASQQLDCPNPVSVQTAKGNLMFDSITADFAHTNIKGTRLRGKFLVEDLP